ncbi:hypothetical protein OS128_00190 [Corynebacterium sp. P5848]|uniref:LGFP repeat-containing protein n=1 Tax=Corynebacterium marambiense TaxID=2765364 RepID=UPI002260A2C0|nr:hypothetical protein [Corynebacterium marambiense]MCX7541338.1 hypothetical protein [Corynebacterium marambiense]
MASLAVKYSWWHERLTARCLGARRTDCEDENRLRSGLSVVAASLLVAGQLSFAHAVAEEPSAAQIPVVDSALAGEKAESEQYDPDFFPEVDGSGGMSRQEVEQAQEEMAQMYSKEQLVSEAKKTSRRSKRSTHCERFLPTNIEVCGAILQKYKEVGGPVSQYLWPVEPMAQNPDGQGFRPRFQNGFIYWHPQAGAHTVSTYTAEYWKRQGWEAGWMGYPTTDEFGVRDGQGTKQVFQHADVYRSPLWTIASVKGRIRDRYNELGGVEGELGYPLTSELATPDGRGR